MANLLDQLKAEGYDTSQVTPELISQLKTEGFDTSSIESPSTPIDKVKDFALNELKNPVNYIPGASMARVGMAALDKSQEGYDLMGNMANEALSKQGHTTLGPAIGGIIQNIPAGVNTAAALEATPAMAEGLTAPFKALKEFATSPVTKAAAGKAMGAAEKDAGVILRSVSKQSLATDLGMKKSAPIEDIINEVTDRLDRGQNLNPQTAKNFINKGKSLFATQKFAPESPEGAALSQAMDKARTYLKTAIPGYQSASDQFAQAAPQVEALKKLGSIAKTLTMRYGIPGVLGGSAAGLGWKLTH